MQEIINYGWVLDIIICIGGILFLATVFFIFYNFGCSIEKLIRYFHNKHKQMCKKIGGDSVRYIILAILSLIVMVFFSYYALDFKPIPGQPPADIFLMQRGK